MGRTLWLKFACIWLWCCMIQCHPDTSRLSFHQSLTPSLGSIAAVSNSYEDEEHRDCVQFIVSQYCCLRRSTSSDSIIWNGWVQDSNMERCAESQRPPISICRKDRRVTPEALMDLAAASRASSQEVRSFARQQVSARTVRRNESRFCLQHQDGRIRVLRQRGERTLAACIRHRHTDPSPVVMI
ncbi:uncharacterized protein TNCV_1335031 [Trichonephila clavipes]|nr:uncharacterized protein TNCV_1335031 [Trichonephila clavipes]